MFNSDFDNLKSNAVLPELSPVGIYNGLFWNSFSIVPVSDVPVSVGFRAHSPPNQIDNGIPERATNGTAYITSTYSGSNVTSFDFTGFFFGCAPDLVTGEVTLFDNCTVAVTGFKAETNQKVGPVKFKFEPSKLSPPMVFAKLPSPLFDGLNKATFVPTAATTTGKTQILALDNVQYNVTYS
ncbi:MAG: hypothetical protein Q9223_001943 [Gallowayella weberi]